MNDLLHAYASVFSGKPYLHRISNTGDLVASYLYEDLLSLGESKKFVSRVQDRAAVVNTGNQVKGKKGRRGDGTFGRAVPSADPVQVEGYSVWRAPIANLEIGAEVKIIATKMLAQIDRVTTDLLNQAKVFGALNPHAIKIAFVGVNHADEYVGYEGDRTFRAKKSPSRESAEIMRRLDHDVRAAYDEFLFLPYRATNIEPFPFSWVNQKRTREEYTSLLVRVSDAYERRF